MPINMNAGNGISHQDELLLKGSTPTLRFTDTDTGADSYLTASSTGGALSLMADSGNESNTTKIYFACDGDEVGHFRGNNSYVGSLRLFPVRSDNTAQGIFFGTEDSDGSGDWSSRRVIHMDTSNVLHLNAGSSTTGIIQVGTSSATIASNGTTYTGELRPSTIKIDKATGGYIHLRKSAGAVASGDHIGSVTFRSDDGSDGVYETVASIKVTAEADHTGSVKPTKMELGTANTMGSSGNPTTALTLDKDQDATFAADVTVGSTLYASSIEDKGADMQIINAHNDAAIWLKTSTGSSTYLNFKVHGAGHTETAGNHKVGGALQRTYTTVTHSSNTHTCDLSVNDNFIINANAATNTIALTIADANIGQSGNIVIVNASSGTVAFAALPSYMLTPDSATINFVTANNAVSLISYLVISDTDAGSRRVLVNYVGNFG